MSNDNPLIPESHSFVVRIWWEPGLTRPDGHPLWRGYVQYAASDRSLVFQSLQELVDFIQSQTGALKDDHQEPTDLANRKSQKVG